MINKVILVGNVGMDPEVRSLESGVKVARIRMATTERIYNRQTQESTEQTEWHTVTLWRGLADVADKYIRKGSQIYIEGSLRTREWSDKEGNKRYSTEVQGNELKLLGRRSDAPAEGGYSAAAPAPAAGGYNAPSAGGYNAPSAGGYSAPAAAPAPVVAATNEVDDLPF